MTTEFLQALSVLLVPFTSGMIFTLPWIVIAILRKAGRWGADFHR